MNKEEILKKMAALCLAVYGKKEKIPTNNDAVMEILADVDVADLDFDKPANSKEQGSWHIALYQNKGADHG